MSRGLGALLNRLLLNGKLSSLLLDRSRGGLLGLGNLFLMSLGSLLILASVLKETLNGCLANHLDTCNLLALKLLKQSALVLPIIELELHLPKSLKCLNCPDWDFCAECIKNAKYIHPRHRFV